LLYGLDEPGPGDQNRVRRLGLEDDEAGEDRLQAYTTHIRKVIIDMGRLLEADTGTHMMQQMLRQFSEHIVEHHKRVPNSRVGVDEILEVGKETDFTRRGALPAENVHHLFDTVVSHGMAMFQCLDMVAQVIKRQLKERDHPIPVECALVTISKAMPQLNHTVLRVMPLEKWSGWLHSIGISDLGNIVTERVSEALASATAPPSTPEVASSAWLNNVGFNRPPIVISSGGARGRAHVKKTQRGPDGELDASFSSLFGSAPELSQDIPSPTADKTRSALGEISQGRANDASTSSKTTKKKPSSSDHSKMLPPSTPKPRANRQISVHSAAQRLTNDLQNAQKPFKALSAPIASRHVSSKSTPTALHVPSAETFDFAANHLPTGQKHNNFISGMSGTVTDTSERLRSERNLNTKGIRTLARPLLAPIEEQSETSSIHSSRIQSALDRDGDSQMGEGDGSEEESEDDS
jgi:hypothetical protein